MWRRVSSSEFSLRMLLSTRFLPCTAQQHTMTTLTCLLLGGVVPLASSTVAPDPSLRSSSERFDRRLGLAGFNDHSVTHDDLTRSYMMYIPNTVNATNPATGLVLLFHGNGVSAEDTCDGVHAYSFAAKREADDYRFIVVCPRGTGISGKDNGWHASDSCCGPWNIKSVDDVGFVSKMLDELEQNLLQWHGVAYPTQNVFAMGFSTGGLFSYRLGCELGSRLNGIAPAGAAWRYAFAYSYIEGGWPSQCTDGISVYNTMGTDDEYTRVDVALNMWREYSSDVLSCDGSVDTLSLSEGEVTCHAYASCGTGCKRSKFCSFDGHDHSVRAMGTRYGVWHLEHAWEFLASEPRNSTEPSQSCEPVVRPPVAGRASTRMGVFGFLFGLVHIMTSVT